MPLSKNVTVISNDITLTAGGGPTTTSSSSFTAGWHKMVHIKLTNGATAPSTPASAEVQASPDNTNFYTLSDLGSLTGSTASNGVQSYTKLTFAAVQYLRVVWTHGPDGNDVTARAEISEVGEIAQSLTDTAGTNLVGAADNTAIALRIIGNVASDAADSGNPLKVGGIARTTNPTAVADADRIDAFFDDLGRQVIVSASRDLVTSNNITLTSTTETTLLAAGGAGVFHDAALITLSNTSSTAVRVDIRDSTAGSVLFSMFLAADGGGAVIPFNPPLPQTTANNNWTAQLSAAVTDVRIKIVAINNV